MILVEDQALLREGLAGLFRDAGHDVVALGECGDLEGAVGEHAPDVVVLDVRLPPSFTDEGTRAAAALKSTRPDLGVVLLSQHIETAHSVELAGLGGFGYLLKDRVLDVSDFLSAVSRVADGGSALDAQVVAAGRTSRTTTSGACAPTASSRASQSPSDCHNLEHAIAGMMFHLACVGFSPSSSTSA